MTNLMQRLVKVRASIEYLKKTNQSGDGRFSYNYVGSDNVLMAIKAAMDEQGVMVLPSVVDADIREHTTKNGDHQYFTVVTIDFTVVNADEPTDSVVLRGHGQGLDSGEKGIGKALTYAEKYFFLKLFNVPTPKDDPDATENRPPTDSGGYTGPQGGGASPAMCSEKQRKMIWAIACKLWPDTDYDAQQRQQLLQVQARALRIPDSTSDMTSAQASALIDQLDKVKAGKEGGPNGY